jgi:hypothetical protein
MKMTSCAIAAVAVFAATEASAQMVNLTGMYRCVEACRAAPVGSPAFVTQNGWTLNLLNEAGQPSRAWPDSFAPATRIWADAWNEGAVYSPDGMTIQFDNERSGSAIWDSRLRRRCGFACGDRQRSGAARIGATPSAAHRGDQAAGYAGARHWGRALRGPVGLTCAAG